MSLCCRLHLQFVALTVTTFVVSAATGAEPRHELAHSIPQVDEETRSFWSFQPIERPAVPTDVAADRRSTPIDAFVFQRLQTAGLRPNPRASRQTLIRRAYYDLIGLPPTPEEVQQFLADSRPDAFPRLVDRLLASPHYGEKWGRHWLDLVRFAETNSYERDETKPNAWRYRDYVIDSFNADQPYDEFIREQLAGDEIPDRTHDQLIATGFYRLGAWDDEPADAKQALYDDLDDILTTTSQVFLGLTINCARCHDHKLDPIPQADYYRLLAFLGGVTRYGGPDRGRDLGYSQVVLAPPDEAEAYSEEIARHRARMKQINLEISAVEELLRSQLPGGQLDDFQYEKNRVALVRQNVPQLFSPSELEHYLELRAQRQALDEQAPTALDTALAVTEVGSTPRDTFVLIRGNPHAEADQVQPGFPSVLDVPDPTCLPPENGRSSGRRTALAQWISSPDNPLTARVMVNRIWQFHFGRGIVASPNNFGLQGNAPTHPQLLDWLAAEFIADGWRLKPLHRLIMSTAAYQRSSADRPDALAVDPENRWLWRYPMRRLTAEEIRDSILAVNGSLNTNRGGPSIYPTIPAEVLAGQSRPGAGWGESTPAEQARRSVYIFVKRSLITPLIASFDGPDTDFTCPVRFATTQPTQALSMINGSFIRKEAAKLREFVQTHAGSEPSQQIELCLRRVLQREPTRTEVERGLALIQTLEQEGADPATAMQSFCVVALNLNEFLYLD